ncbi:MAG: hypothetical protein V3W19_07520, partial [Desulfatiglandales bacterium]
PPSLHCSDVTVDTPKLPLSLLLVTLFLGFVNVLHVNVISMAEATLLIPRKSPGNIKLLADAFKSFDPLRMIRDTLLFDLGKTKRSSLHSVRGRETVI